jgi:uncharacterized protein (DUF983 family)
MSTAPPDPRPAPAPRDPPRLGTYLARALRLRCPECGHHPIFVPVRRVRSLYDWFFPLDGCPECGYAYEREEGYFLLATWVVNYGLVAGGGLAIGLLLQELTAWSTTAIVLLLAAVMPFASVALARHAKAVFLAIDHYFDPQRPAARRPPP